MDVPNGKKHLFGVVKVGEKGQIVIPKEAREIFHIKPGDSLMVLGDEEQGLALIRNDDFVRMWEQVQRLRDTGRTDENTEGNA